MNFSVKAQNLPSNAAYWFPVFAVFSPSSQMWVPTKFPNISRDEIAYFEGVPEIALLFGAETKDANYEQVTPGDWWGTFAGIMDGGKYIADFADRKLKVEPSTFEKWLPMSPFEGPPLPRCFGIKWPWL